MAALFALHPLHVESVAWVSERKDVLSALFFLLTLWAYVAVRGSRRDAEVAKASQSAVASRRFHSSTFYLLVPGLLRPWA